MLRQEPLRLLLKVRTITYLPSYERSQAWWWSWPTNDKHMSKPYGIDETVLTENALILQIACYIMANIADSPRLKQNIQLTFGLRGCGSARFCQQDTMPPYHMVFRYSVSFCFYILFLSSLTWWSTFITTVNIATSWYWWFRLWQGCRSDISLILFISYESSFKKNFIDSSKQKSFRDKGFIYSHWDRTVQCHFEVEQKTRHESLLIESGGTRAGPKNWASSCLSGLLSATRRQWKIKKTPSRLNSQASVSRYDQNCMREYWSKLHGAHWPLMFLMQVDCICPSVLPDILLQIIVFHPFKGLQRLANLLLHVLLLLLMEWENN